MQISAKDLGWLKTDDFCPRCFWITRHDRKLPYQTPFAGIFSSIDSYTKSVVAKYFEKHGRLPDWLGGIGDVKRLVKVNASNFRTEKDGTILTGIPDELFERPDGSYGIIDYKTARYTGTQDTLMPVYEVQLNGYAYIAEAIGDKPVKDLTWHTSSRRSTIVSMTYEQTYYKRGLRDAFHFYYTQDKERH